MEGTGPPLSMRIAMVTSDDLNILHRYGEHGDSYWAARYATVFDRAQAMGLQFVGPQRHMAGRRPRGRRSCRKTR
jgi:hypothetical protein